MPGLNDALDRFVGAALAVNLPVTVINHATGPHAFDLFDDTRTSRDIVNRYWRSCSFISPHRREAALLTVQLCWTVSQTFASWNLIGELLRRLDALKRAA